LGRILRTGLAGFALCLLRSLIRAGAHPVRGANAINHAPDAFSLLLGDNFHRLLVALTFFEAGLAQTTAHPVDRLNHLLG
jgi:hypothetical protein